MSSKVASQPTVHRLCDSGPAIPGFFHKLEKIQFGPSAEDGISGSHVGPKEPHAFGSAGQNHKGDVTLSGLPPAGGNNEKGVGEPCRLLKLRSILHPAGKAESPAPDPMDQPSYVHGSKG